MPFLKTLGNKQPASRNHQGERRSSYHLNVADLFRIRQMMKTFQDAEGEIKGLKERISRLEEALAKRSAPATAAIEEINDLSPPTAIPPLPIAELKELAAMAKKFK